MEATIDMTGRVLVPKAIRDALGLAFGSKVDVSAYGDAIRITPGGRTASLIHDASGRLVAQSDTPVTDDQMFALIDSGRR
ncbi:MAG: AbrB/MazE/SpoVT family DNA-binding domain-containing protein [Propionibacteriaceae bacterium]|jgi:AbrB family looped-hinge helix DNA binding protein|nr:AbrB/MazE/SpoVT family DNA-binding domain-containing protein [Propionibacteriaceae bacterium]